MGCTGIPKQEVDGQKNGASILVETEKGTRKDGRGQKAIEGKKSLNPSCHSDAAGKNMRSKGVADHDRESAESTPISRKSLKCRRKALIVGGAILMITGIALAVYLGAYENEPFLIALGPTFIGVMIIIAALFGKRL